MRSLYREHGSAERVAELLGCSNTTVAKYVRDLFPKGPTDAEVVRAFRLTGRLRDAGELVGLTHVTVWRRLQRAGVSVGSGAADAWRLYKTLRQRISRSEWRARVLKRDECKCRKCGAPSVTVHHVKRLAVIRNEVAARTGIDPFSSYQSLRAFTDAVMAAHKLKHGIVLCTPCHNFAH